MPDMPTPEDLEHFAEEEEKPRRGGSLASAYIPDVVEGAVDVAVDLAEPAVEAAAEAGGTILESAAEAVGDLIGSVVESIFK